MNINNKQKFVILIYSGLLVILILFPPWAKKVYNYEMESSIEFNGYHFINHGNKIIQENVKGWVAISSEVPGRDNEEFEEWKHPGSSYSKKPREYKQFNELKNIDDNLFDVIYDSLFRIEHDSIANEKIDPHGKIAWDNLHYKIKMLDSIGILILDSINKVIDTVKIKDSLFEYELKRYSIEYSFYFEMLLTHLFILTIIASLMFILLKNNNRVSK